MYIYAFYGAWTQDQKVPFDLKSDALTIYRADFKGKQLFLA